MSDMIRIGLPKGRVLEQSIDLLRRVGIRESGDSEASRKLIVPDETGAYEFVLLKPIDIPVYVESGAIDTGIVGSDILHEWESDVYEPLDLQIGKCKLSLATPKGASLPQNGHFHIATKYPRTAKQFFDRRNTQVHIVKLEGSVEIAPLLGLADAIVDLVETGRTLKENGLVIVEDIALISTKLIVNRTAMKLKGKRINQLITQLDKVVYANS